MDEKILERFMAKVAKTDECWLWTATKSRGYGHMRVGPNLFYAHRLAFEHWNGPLGNMKCLHTCDNPACVNPEHLFKGTQKDNVRDMVSKGRRASTEGEKHPRAKLTEKQVLEIRELAKTQSQRAIGELFGITQTHVGYIIKRKSWSHL